MFSRIINIRLTTTVIVALAIAFSSCNSSTSVKTSGRAKKPTTKQAVITLKEITLTTSSTSPEVGDQFQFKATGIYSDKSTQDITSKVSWSASSSVLEVAASGGSASALKEGSADVTATFENISGQLSVVVGASSLTKLFILPGTGSNRMGVKQSMSVIGVFANGVISDLTKSVAWTSSNASVATIDSSVNYGLTTLLAGGTSTITASRTGITTSRVLTVEAYTLTSLTVAPSTLLLANGYSSIVSVVGTYSDGQKLDLTSAATWSSSFASIATISDAIGRKGITTGVLAGSTTLTANVLGFTGQSVVNVTAATLSTITLSPSTLTIAPRTQAQITAEGSFSDLSRLDLTFSAAWASPSSSFSVNDLGLSKGIILAKSDGSGTVTASQNSVSGTAGLIVSSATLVSIAVTPSAPSLTATGQIQLKATGTFSDSTTQDITKVASWSSSSVATAIVGSNDGPSAGLVSGNANGTAVVTATFSDKNGTTNVTITGGAARTLSSIIVTPANTTLSNGSTQQFTATGVYSDSTTTDITSSSTWASSSASVLTINSSGLSSGLVTTLASGTSSVSATLSSVSGSTQATVTLNQAPPPTPTSLAATVVSSAQLNYSWTSAGGTTASYRYAYQAGSTPATCSTAPTGTTSQTSVSLTGLTPNTSYTFIVCALNANSTPDQSAATTGVTAATLALSLLTYSGASFAEGATNLGAIAATHTITVANDTFVAGPFVSGTAYSVAGVPSGLTLVVTRTSSTVLTLSFTGNAASHANANDTSIVNLTLNAAAFTSGVASANNNPKSLIIDFNDPSTLTYSGTSFVEDGPNNGSIIATRTITLANDTFTSGTYNNTDEYTVTGVPSGLTLVVTPTSTTVLTLSFTGSAASHANANDTSSISLTLNAAAFTSTTASTSNNPQSLSVDFFDAPVVTSVNSPTANGSYKVAGAIAVTVTFSQVVIVTGTPRLTLETGATDAVVDYSSGSGTTTLTFNYTVAASETSSDLDYVATTSLALNSGTIKDATGIDATLTLPAPGAANSLGANREIVIDTTAPTVTFSSVSAGNPGSTLTPTFLGTGSETSTVTLYFDSACATAKSAATANTVFASPGIAVNANVGSNTTTIIYGIAVDTAGNASAGCTSLVTYTHDNVAPVVSVSAGVSSDTANGSYKQSGVIAIKVTFSEAVTVTGTPQLTLETGGSDAVVDYTSGSGSTVLVFNYTVGAGHTSTDLDYASTTALALNSGTIKDSALNAATLTLATVGAANSLGASNNFVIDTTVPVITYTSISPASPGSSQTPAVTLSLSEASGTTGLGLYSESGCGTSIATAVTGTSGSNAVTTTSLTSGSTTTIYAKATDVAGNVSTCTSMVSYTHSAGGGGGGGNSWSATTSTSVPVEAYYHSAVWTGSKMIVWGGTTNGTSGISTGGLYDPVTNAWTATTSTSVPTARMNHTAVWTGAHMIVWGGTAAAAKLDTGAKYDPVLNSWTATTSTSAPAARTRHVAVWTGSKMVVWGGYHTSGSITSTGSRYDPYTDVWTATSDPTSDMTPYPHDGAVGAVAVWTGAKMLFYGGQVFNSSDSHLGGMYDPAGNTWTSMTTTGTPTCAAANEKGCLGESGVWTGSKLIVWGGSDNDDSVHYNSGAVYDVASNSWTATTTTSAPSARSYHSAVWTGAKMVIFGGCKGGSCATKLNDAFEYNPVTNAWAATTTTSLPVVRSSQTAVWTGSQMLVWGGKTTSAVAVNSGGAYSPQFQTYTTGSGNFTVPTGVTSVIVEVWGAGGGGGAAGTTGSDQGAAGGGGGGYTRKTLTVSAGETIAYVVGAGGAGNPTANNGAAGTTGDLSSATYSGTTYTANGGVGGVGNAGSGVVGTGGTATNGDENRTGGSGSLKSANHGGGGGSSAGSGSNGTNAPTASATSQPGGTPPQGGGFGGYGGWANSGTHAGGAGVSPGGGGGGGGKDSTLGGGGAGASGAVSFHW